MEELAAGLYERLITEDVLARIEALRAEGRGVIDERVDTAVVPDVLASHVGAAVTAVLQALPADERVAAANDLLDYLQQVGSSGLAPGLRVAAGPYELREVAPAGDQTGVTYRRPQIPLRQSDLLVNARGEPVLAHELAAEITSADCVDLLCAFIKWQGLRLLIEPLRELVRRGVPVRVITTTYVGATERRAVDALVELGAEVKISYETQRTRLHAKAWLFRRLSGADTAYVGSSNLSRSALVDGLEWNVRLSRAQNAPLLDKFEATFDSYWQDPHFESYDPERDGARLDEALGRAFRREPLRLAGLEVRPFPYQQEILDRLDVERHVHDRWRNLVVAATGTGKTVIAALDFKRLLAQLGDLSLLFVAHRREILDQSRLTFASVLNDAVFGELYVSGERPERWRHVFASIQSLTSYGVERLAPDHFDVVIVDEFHHAEASTYRRLLEHLRPRVLLGLTATPERADGQDVTQWFGGRIAAELRLWEALEQELLSPFHYFGVSDNTDLRGIDWRRGGYDIGELDNLYTGNDARARVVLTQVHEKVPDVRQMRALGFCVSKAHAAYMARVFTDAGIEAVAIDADTPMPVRLEQRARLAQGDLKAIFSVDVFNEGLDVPNVDTVLFLRPTESSTVFLQQLGRGLRHAPGKACLTVLDFIGYQNQRFRFDLRYSALTGVPRRSLERTLEEGFPFLPTGCVVELDRVAQKAVLDNLRVQLRVRNKELTEELRREGDVTLAQYLDRTDRAVTDVYRRSTWTALRRAAGLRTEPAGPDEDALLKRMHRLVRVDDKERTTTWSRWLASPAPVDVDVLSVRARRLADMLFFTLWPNGGGFESAAAGLSVLWRHPAVRAEALEVLALAEDAIDHMPVALDGPDFVDVPLAVHGRYTREELLAATGHASLTRKPSSDMQGVRYVEAIKSDAFTFTLQKAERDYSPTTMYRDYALSPDLVHWESQSTTSVESPTGRRYLEHRERGTHVLLFARETNDDELGARPFLFLGEADYVSHEGSRPIAITWRLHVPMPADFFTSARVLAG
ncbi:MAG TPA: DUF3427 domain-containing protein [Acidimicrobiales bacterium]|nr:DUF3427 domain-containing protein [Acidimicrobiales bacterium]